MQELPPPNRHIPPSLKFSIDQRSFYERQVNYSYSLYLRIQDLLAFMDNPVVFTSVSITGNYTASGWDWINAKNGVTITFPETPIAGSEIIVRNGDGSSITINGNGKLINSSSSVVIGSQGTSIRFKYFATDNEWYGT